MEYQYSSISDKIHLISNFFVSVFRFIKCIPSLTFLAKQKICYRRKSICRKYNFRFRIITRSVPLGSTLEIFFENKQWWWKFWRKKNQGIFRNIQITKFHSKIIYVYMYRYTETERFSHVSQFLRKLREVKKNPNSSQNDRYLWSFSLRRR